MESPRQLIAAIAWRLQANAEGDLSEQARERALAIADDADIRVLPPRHFEVLALKRTTAPHRTPSQDVRLPKPGTVLGAITGDKALW